MLSASILSEFYSGKLLVFPVSVILGRISFEVSSTFPFLLLEVEFEHYFCFLYGQFGNKYMFNAFSVYNFFVFYPHKYRLHSITPSLFLIF